jgi:hypothetical protein
MTPNLQLHGSVKSRLSLLLPDELGRSTDN